MRFFVAKVNLTEQSKLGFTYLRPLQVAYESPKFMLPLRLGMVNANGPQELFVYALTRKGRVETTNYRTVKLPLGHGSAGLPQGPREFSRFYKAMFTRQVEKQDGRAVFLEYAWDMRWCDPCAADPLSNDELRSLGVFWQDGARAAAAERLPHAAARPLRRRAFPRGSGVPGNRRPHQLPGPLCPAPRVDRRRARATAPRAIAARVAERQEAGSAAARVADRLACRRNPEEDGARRKPLVAAGRGGSGSGRIDKAGIRQKAMERFALGRTLQSLARRRVRGRRPGGLGSLRPRVPAGAVSRGRRARSARRRARSRRLALCRALRHQDAHGERQSLFRYFQGRSSLATWLRAVLAQRYVDRLRAGRRLEPLPTTARRRHGQRRGDAASAACRPIPIRNGARYVALLRRALARSSARSAAGIGCGSRATTCRSSRSPRPAALLQEHEATVSRQLARTRRRNREDVERALAAMPGWAGRRSPNASPRSPPIPVRWT